MTTYRTLEQITTLNKVEYNHWGLMCDLSNNDYDISYFGGRVTANSNFNDFLQDLDSFDINEIIVYLDTELMDCQKENEIYKNEYNISNENYVGYIDEIQFLLSYVKFNYYL